MIILELPNWMIRKLLILIGIQHSIQIFGKFFIVITGWNFRIISAIFYALINSDLSFRA
jgi:uncharacterized membrane protein YvlD (DUF360 family)